MTMMNLRCENGREMGWKNEMTKHLLIVNTKRQGNHSKEISHFPISPSPFTLCVLPSLLISHHLYKQNLHKTQRVTTPGNPPFPSSSSLFVLLTTREEIPFCLSLSVFLFHSCALPLIRHHHFFAKSCTFENENSDRHTQDDEALHEWESVSAT